MESFGSYLRDLRKQKRLTLKQVEKLARVSNSFLSQVERGLRNPPHPDILNRLANVYGISPHELLDAAGYIKKLSPAKRLHDEIERAYEHVITDPAYNQGTRMR